ncbi:SusC/RagA family TonB-linked outer membrane protein [Segatella bryantii]|uniref:SusC/RagA family TonB-linked outer membrane protein n=1 Tax=Segatella bryantii TaxID=77095 RepID=UPI00242B9652|nr:SusC/RagA family TonB-linked outer membrane protein [Segatella bryantii]
MEKRLMTFFACLFLSLGMALAQTQASGTVLSSEDGEPVVGASLKIVGTKIGAVTDIDGHFSVVVPTGSKLEVSYLGMITKVVSASSNMTIKLDPDNKVLDEVVVTAMGVSRDKKALGYAAQSLNASELNKAGTSSLASAMQGKLTGVDIRTSSGAPGASAQITIRGARSFDGNNTPLYVVDGMPISSQADYSTGNSVTGADQASRTIDINPEDIESINILKGQAASALYGIRASNGVVLITTKRGHKQSNKPVITFSTDLSAQTVSRKFKHQDVYAQGNSIDAYNPNSSMTWGPKISELANDPTYGGNTNNKYTNGDLTSHAGQYYNPKYASAGLDGWTTPQTYDNVSDFFRTGFTQNSTFNISQMKNDVSYSFSISDTYQNGIIPSTGMTRTGARGAVDWKVNDQWKTGFSANYSAVKITSAPGANNGIMNVVYSAPAEYNLKGTPYSVPGDPTSQVLFRSTTFNNPYWWADNDEFSQHTNRVFGNAYAEYRPKFNWDTDKYNLVFREQAGIDVYTTNNSTVAEIGSAYNNKGEVENYGVQVNIFNNLFTANFTAKWGADKEWDFGFLLGNEFNHESKRYWDYDGSGLAFYGQPVIGNTTSIDIHSEYNHQERTVGTFGQLSLSWKNMLFFTTTGRNDIVSTMPRGNRSFFYPSVSLGWIFTEIPALKSDFLSYGKLRTSYAQVGQAGQFYSNYMYVPSYGSGMYNYTPISYPLGGATAYSPYYVKFDENLKPQNTSNWEMGLDLGLLKNRVKVEYTLSYQDVKDQIFDVPTAGSTGYQYLRTNAGRMTTWAHELSVKAAIVESKDWNVDLGVNFTSVNNKVKELAEGVESIMLGGFVEPQIRAQAGYTYPNIYGYAFKRAEDGQLLLVDGLPQATSASVNLGECTPDFNMGFNLNVNYKRLNLAATLDWQKGGRMYNGTILTMNYFGATEESLPYHEGTMVAEGIDEATGQKNTVEVSKQEYYQAYNNVTEAGIFDTSYLKLRDLTLSYNLPKFAGIDMSVYAFARNILLWSKMPNLDPESSQGNGNMSGYFERFSVPNTSSFGGGFRITF